MRILIVIAAPDENQVPAQLEGHWAIKLATEEHCELPWTIRVVLFSTESPLADGRLGGKLSHSPAIQAPIVTSHGWELVPLLDDSDIIHICRPYTQAGEIAVLGARLLGKHLSASELSVRTSELGRSLGLMELVDVVVCNSEEELVEASWHRAVERVDLYGDDWCSRVTDVFSRLVAESGHAP